MVKLYCAMMDVFIQWGVPMDLHITVIFIGIYFFLSGFNKLHNLKQGYNKPKMFNLFFRLDLRTLVWEPMFVGTGQEGEPLGRYRHEIARVGNKLYIIGGGTGEWAFELMEIPMFDFENNTWSILTPKADDSGKDTISPLPRKCHSAVQIDSPEGPQVFVAGGSDGNSVFEDIWRLNISDLQWTLMQKTVLPHPLYFHSSAVTSSGCMYVFGGIEPKEDATSRNNILYKVWLCLPKLSEMCWEALLHFHPNIDQVDGRSLLNAGIPSHFVQRLHMQ